MSTFEMAALWIMGGVIAAGFLLAAYYFLLAAASGAGETNDGEDEGEER